MAMEERRLKGVTWYLVRPTLAGLGRAIAGFVTPWEDRGWTAEAVSVYAVNDGWAATVLLQNEWKEVA